MSLSQGIREVNFQTEQLEHCWNSEFTFFRSSSKKLFLWRDIKENLGASSSGCHWKVLQSQQEIKTSLASWDTSSKVELANTLNWFYPGSRTQIPVFQRQQWNILAQLFADSQIPELYPAVTKLDFTCRASKREFTCFCLWGQGKNKIYSDKYCRKLISVYSEVVFIQSPAWTLLLTRESV